MSSVIRVIGYLLLVAAVVAIGMAITKGIWESDMPTWLKIFILR